METLHVGSWLVGVEYDDERARQAIRKSCAAWLVTDRAAEVAAFGVRTARVGFRRRRVGLVHHGAPIRWRGDDLEDAARTLATVMRDLARADEPEEVRVAARVFVRGPRSVLVDSPPARLIDDLPLTRAGIVEVPCWHPTVETDPTRVRVGDRSYELAGAVLGGRRSDATEARQTLWSLGTGETSAWAWAVDGLGTRLRTTMDDVEPAIVDLLSDVR